MEFKTLNYNIHDLKNVLLNLENVRLIVRNRNRLRSKTVKKEGESISLRNV